MDRIRRNERMTAMMKLLSGTPNRIFTLSSFCELFGSAKSTMSEDVDLLQQVAKEFDLGTVETVTGAAGGVRFRPAVSRTKARAMIQELCAKLSGTERVLPGGFLYYSDILSMPEIVNGMGEIIATEYAQCEPDFVLTMETKGIPVAFATANALGVPLVIARHSSRVYEGSAVNINYVSGSGSIEPARGEGEPARPDRGRLPQGRRHGQGYGRADARIQRQRGGHGVRDGHAEAGKEARLRREEPDDPERDGGGSRRGGCPARGLADAGFAKEGLSMVSSYIDDSGFSGKGGGLACIR